MAQRSSINRVRLTSSPSHSIVRFREIDRNALEKHLFQRYPKREWGTFFRFGWRRTTWGVALFFVDALWPGPGDLDRQTSLTTFTEQYSRRAFEAARNGEGLGVGVIHSHPAGYGVLPSELDDDMDLYFGKELVNFASGAPYASLIFQRSDELGFTFSGRVFDRGEWLPVTEFLTSGDVRLFRESHDLNGGDLEVASSFEADRHETVARLTSLMGEHSAKRLRSSVVGVVGCSGTGSPAIEVLTRAGVGEFVLVDPDRISKSNLERVHGSYWKHVSGNEFPLKVDLMRQMILEINPSAKVTSFAGNILHENVLDEFIRCDALMTCVDTEHGRVAASDFAKHYLLPSVDLGVRMSGRDGKVTEQIVDLTVFSPERPCAFCGRRIDTAVLAVELMTEEEKERRKQQAYAAIERGANPDHYWRNLPRQLHTVGYLTTAVGGLAAGYLEGWLTGTFTIPHSTMQFDPSKANFGMVTPERTFSVACTCRDKIGWGDAARSYRNISLPSHWSKRAVIRSKRV